MRIFVVDDEIEKVNPLRAHLASSGHQVVIVNDGRQALSLRSRLPSEESIR